MNISVITSNDEAIINYEYIMGFAFKNAAIKVECALLPVICAGFALSRYNCAHFSNRNEYLEPHRSVA